MIAGLSVVRAVCAAELRQTLRDPHVVAYLLGPLALYPMLFWGTSQLAMDQQARFEREPVRIEVEASPEIALALSDGRFVTVSGGVDGVRDGTVDVRVSGTDDALVLHHSSTRPRSVRALSAVRNRLQALREERLVARAVAAGIAAETLRPWTVRQDQRGGVLDGVTQMLSAAIAGLAGLSMLLAAVYPTIVVVVGEREQGTLETLLVSAAPRWALLAGKAAACTILVSAAAFGNGASLHLTLVHLLALVLPEGALALAVPPADLVLAAPAVVSGAFLATSLCMASVLPARTFKDAELAATFAILLGMAPMTLAMLAVFSGNEEAATWVPLANVVVVGAHALDGRIDVVAAALATLENTAIGALVLLAIGWVTARADLGGAGRRAG